MTQPLQLIGMLDSPFVRRVAISLQLLHIPFEHRALSVFRNFPELAAINPVVRVPTLVCADGTVLMDSNIILEYAEMLASPDHTLMSLDMEERKRIWRLTGLALAAGEKCVQYFYERSLRPAEKIHQPWLERVSSQIGAAFAELEKELKAKPLIANSSAINQAGVCTAVMWHFAQTLIPEVVPEQDFPKLHHFSSQAEQLPEFKAAPHGLGTYPHSAS